MSGPCERCGGARHRYDSERNTWVACECLRARRVTTRYARAGVPIRFSDETWRTLLSTYSVSEAKRLVGVAKALREGRQPEDWPLIGGSPSRARQLLATLLLRAACDGCLEARAMALPELIDVEFERGQSALVLATPVLILTVGNEPKNRFNRIVLEKALNRRWGHQRFTALVTGIDVARLATNYGSRAIDEALEERFFKVRLGPKEST